MRSNSWRKRPRKSGVGSFGRGKSNLIDLVAILHLNPVKIQKL
jgi:hypothetical protein